MKIGSGKKEGWLGIVLTVVLCLGFLYWWFRPAPLPWQHETPAQLVARAAAEPPPDDPVERQVLDFDFMEVAILQAHGGMLDAAQGTLKQIATPEIRLRAVRQAAQAHLNTDPKDFGEALTLAVLLPEDGGRQTFRAEILGHLAELGFADAALPEAQTPLQKAALARKLAATNSQETARTLLTEAAAALPGLAPADAAAVKREMAWARVHLSIIDSPDEAAAAIEALPPGEQTPLWEELAGWCQGRQDREAVMPKLMERIKDPALRRRLEIESLLLYLKLRPAAELLAECQADVDRAAAPADKVAALLTLADCQRNAADASGAEAAAEATLKLAGETARGIPDAAARSRTLLQLARRLSSANLFADAAAALEQSIAAAGAVSIPAQRVPLLVSAADEAWMQAQEAKAVQLLHEAEAMVKASADEADAGALEELAVAFVRRGEWPRGLKLVAGISNAAARSKALSAAALTAAEDSMSMDPANPPPRGEPVDGIRREAAGDDERAARLVERQPAGFARARAWLAMAKGLIGPPTNLNDYLNSGDQPVDAPLPPEEESTPPAAEESPPPPR